MSGKTLEPPNSGSCLFPRDQIGPLGVDSREFLRAVLGSQQDRIAILERSGGIIAVNDVWVRFGTQECGAALSCIGPGVNYLAICRHAAMDQDKSAREALEGIESVLEGGADFFEMEYPCDSPASPGWALMTVSPLRRPDGGAVISHVDITRRKVAEESLQKAYSEIRQLRDQLEAENFYLREDISLTRDHGEIIGRSRAIRAVLSQIEQVAETDSTVLVMGETGTGKELVARSIHDLSLRRDHVMLQVNCAALPGPLIESELFGHEKGAFTGAANPQAGRFEVADGGMLFLDEIGELPLELQAKLLRVLQEGRIERLGSARSVPVDVRIIAATNRDLAQAAREGRFREDLYYRLNVFPIVAPPLRERREDIPQLVQVFVQELSAKMRKQIDTIPKGCLEALMQYHWPGNVRELRNVVERALILAKGKSLRIEIPAAREASRPGGQTLEDIQRAHILEILESTNWRVAGSGGAAEILGLKRTTLESKIRRLGIAKPER